ncbi:MAG TPA: TolC family protein, partial [Segetibacter sp.]
MKERIIACVVCVLVIGNLKTLSQTNNNQKLSLKQAVDVALSNNLQVRQSDLQMQSTAVNLSQAKTNIFPDLFSNLNHGTNQGRSIDPFTNSYINQTINYASYNLSSSVVLFNGFQLKNLVKQ